MLHDSSVFNKNCKNEFFRMFKLPQDDGKSGVAEGRNPYGARLVFIP